MYNVMGQDGKVWWGMAWRCLIWFGSVEAACMMHCGPVYTSVDLCGPVWSSEEQCEDHTVEQC